MGLLVNFAYSTAMAIGFSRITYSGTVYNTLNIYQGTIPTDVNAWTAASTSADLLASFTSFYMAGIPTIPSVEDGGFVRLQVTPSTNPVNASASGTATWFALYTTNNWNGWVLGDVSLTTGTAMVRLDSLTLTVGNPVTLTYFGMSFKPH